MNYKNFLIFFLTVLYPAYSIAQKKTPPNIIYIQADDLGWSELGCFGNRFNETPALDLLAKQGIRFTQAYAAAPVCSPTRVALMTGLYPAKTGITDYLDVKDEKFLSPDYLTLNEQMTKAGYHTGLIGKWHLTGDYDKKKGSPVKHGWDEIICSETRYIAGGAYFYPYFFLPEVKPKNDNEYLTDRLNQEAVGFIRKNATKPFFLYLSHYSVHTKLSGKQDKVLKYKNKPGAGTTQNNPELAAMLESIDEGVGNIFTVLKELGIDNNTIIIFTSDNGGETKVTTNAPLRGGKSQLYEGGIRVPLIVYWPEKIKKGITSDVPILNVDIFPTLTAVAGLPAIGASQSDGIDISPLLSGQSTLPARNLFWYYPLAKPHFLGGRSASAVRSGDYKLIEFFDTNTVELYNLKDDVSETTDLSLQKPEKAAELKALLKSWRVKLDI
ncbi:sulfatase [Dyadobacter sp. NIV53]|uniref:sulfatase n=1 Tax=Dyadobacter sp. NIV53 TaxID=2861765 RepID=UPI001C86B536|nr:sulfatase [Dyadobacter sp. NIV53]